MIFSLKLHPQHELNGSGPLRDFFGTKEISRGQINWFYFADNQDVISASGEWTFYDARARSAARTGRTEWRFYYTGEFLQNAREDDEIVLARTIEGELYGLVFRRNSAWLRAARILFSFSEATGKAKVVSEAELDTQALEFTRARILEELGLEILVAPALDDTELVLKQFPNGKFPTTKQMSAFARSLCSVDASTPDEALITWIGREEALFRALEKIEVEKRLQNGFASVEDFISYSLSVQNRRKSRMGHALQNHLSALFNAHLLKYQSQARTEGKNTPDFLFPGETEYQNPAFDASLLVMLGAKSTCKDRWRQVLTEADRIRHKHLCTLETAISRDQTDEMEVRHLSLVLPQQLHQTYHADQRAKLLTLDEFIQKVKTTQAV